MKFDLKKVAKMLNGGLDSGKKLLTGAADLVKAYGTAAIMVLLFSFVSLKLPDMHRLYLRSKVGSKVYMIKDKANGGGGTGFSVKAPSGQTYILTNDHVCEVSGDKATVLIMDDEGTLMRRRIVAHDGNSDLCLIEGLPGVSGLDLAGSAPSLGETVNVIGHPRLFPIHVAQGEMMGYEDISIPIAIISQIDPVTGEEIPVPPEYGGMPEKECNILPKNKVEIVEGMSFFGPIKLKYCVMHVDQAYMTAAIVHGGNSGSPVVNFWGRVEGVVFATDATNYGRIINIRDIKAFLRNY